MTARLRSALLAAALSTASSTALAHGGFFRAYAVVSEPGNPDHMVLRSDVWGFVETRDGGQSWYWTCAEAYTGTSTSTERRSLVIAPGGKVLIADQFDGLQVSAADSTCEFVEAPGFVETVPDAGGETDAVVTSVALSADGQTVFVLTATGLAGGVTSRLWRSTDGAETFERVGDVLPGTADATYSASSIVQAPSNPDRLYVAGKLIGTPGAVVQRSDDGGLTWQSFDVPADSADSWSARMHGVDPNDADVAYFWVDTNEASGAAMPDAIWMTADAGGTWSEVVSGAGDLPGFAFSPDGVKLAVSGPQDGVLLATAADVITSGASAFTQTFDGSVWGLDWRESGLYAGTNDFTPGDEPKSTFGVSTDSGSSFEGVFEICETQLAQCPSGTRAGDLCGATFSDPDRGGFKEDFIEGPRCVGAAGAGGATGGGGAGAGATAGSGGRATSDGGTAPPSEGPGEDAACSCRAPGGHPGTATGWWAAFALAAGTAAMRRRSARHQR